MWETIKEIFLNAITDCKEEFEAICNIIKPTIEVLVKTKEIKDMFNQTDIGKVIGIMGIIGTTGLMLSKLSKNKRKKYR